MTKWLCLLVLLLAPSWATAQEFEFQPPPTPDDPTTPAVMRDLAIRLLPVYSNPDTDRYLTNLAALQLVSGDYTAAYDTRQLLQSRIRSSDVGRPVDRGVLYDIYAKARAIETSDHIQFRAAYTQAFKEVVPKLKDRDAHAVSQWLATPRSVFEDALQKSFDQHRASKTITFQEAVDLIWRYLSFDAYRNFAPLVEALDNEDEGRRYITDENVVIKTKGGVSLHAVVVRPANASEPLPALLEFTIDVSPNDAKASAAHGYAGVVAYTRGKLTPGPGRVTPLQYDGEDARAVIEWIAKQPWSNGSVGLYGANYSGFTAWSAAMHPPAALKAMATASALAPGIDFPMSGNIFRNSAYRWSDANTLHGGPEENDDDELWEERNIAWYTSGKPYSAFARLLARPDEIVRAWLAHPAYDLFWRSKIPYGKQFANIGIPVLTISGYYSGGEPGALYYFQQHLKYKPDADHTLVIGPYADRAPGNGASDMLRRLPTDPAARIDLQELRYQWFDHVLKNAPQPTILKDRVNLQLVGGNEWRHAASLAELAPGRLRFWLNAGDKPDANTLSLPIVSATTSAQQVVDLADRDDSGLPPTELVTRTLPIRNGIAYVSEPLTDAVEFAGLPEGRLDFMTNKRDMDLSITLYELLGSGAYVQLSEPYEFRASYARDRTRRQLLRPGVRQQLPFTSDRLASRKIAAGSRVILVLSVVKRADRQINYGTGGDVNQESIANAKVPMKIQWYSSSFVDLPVRGVEP